MFLLVLYLVSIWFHYCWSKYVRVVAIIDWFQKKPIEKRKSKHATVCDKEGVKKVVTERRQSGHTHTKERMYNVIGILSKVME